MAAIRLGTAANVRGFQELLNAPSTTSHALDREALQDEFGRLRVWSGNLGALQKGHSSLDYRLRDSPLLSSNVLKLLQELEQNISAATAILSGARLPYEQQQKPEKKDEYNEEEDDGFFSEDEDENSENGSPKTELDMRFAEIQDIIDNLYKISVRIRQPTIKSRSLKAASHQPKDPETGVDILAQYGVFDLQHTQELVRHLRTAHASQTAHEGDNNEIVHRLARAVTLRRRQFKYWSRHREKLGVSTLLRETQIQLPVERPQEMHRVDTMEAQPDLQILRLQKEAPSQKTGKTLLSGTEATHHHQSLDDIVDSKSVTSYATTVRDLTGKGIDLPPPPKAADGDKDFECPYCFIICPARYGKGRPWRTHVLQDLQPYVCTYEECELPDQLFRSRKEWVQHEAGHRKAWRCPEHPNAVYKSRDGLRSHLHQVHGHSIPESQLDTIVNVGETSTVDTRPTCPICFARADTEGMNFQNHLANHLERIAAFALPKNSTDETEGASSRASQGRTDSTGSQRMSDVSSISDEDDKEAGEIQLAVTKQSSTQETTSITPGADEMPSLPGLSADNLRGLPDSRQDRLDMLLSKQRSGRAESKEFHEDDTQTRIKLKNRMKVITTEFMETMGAQSGRYFRFDRSWIGIIEFDNEDSTADALQRFDQARYPNISIIEHDNLNVGQHDVKRSIKIRVDLGHDDDEYELRQSSHDDGDDSQSAPTASTASLHYSTDEDDATKETESLSIQQIPSLHSLYRSGKLLEQEQTYAPNDAYNGIISICVANIVLLKVDVIVNSSNRRIRMTTYPSTLNNTVHKAAGPELQAETKGLPKLKIGEAVLTRSYRLPSANIIHVARPHLSTIEGTLQFDLLSRCYQSALMTAKTHQLRTIAFPLLGAGGCGFPRSSAARTALREVRSFLDTCEDQPFERVVFTAYNAAEEKALMDLLPIFFPPTRGDIGSTASDTARRTELGARLKRTHDHIELVSVGLLDFVEQLIDFNAGHHTLDTLTSIMLTLDLLKNTLIGPKETLEALSGEIADKTEQICEVMNAICGSVTEMIELGKAKVNSGQPSYQTIWEDHNSHMKTFQGLDLAMLLERCHYFVQCLEEVLVRNGEEASELESLSLQLKKWLRKQIGRGEQSVLNHFDEILYSRQFQQRANTVTRTDTIKSHQLPSIARLYQNNDLEQMPTTSRPSARTNHIVCLVREDITRLEVDAIVNSTNPDFAGFGSLDRTIQLKGGIHLRQECAGFRRCAVGEIKVTRGHLLPAKHIIHVVLPEVYQPRSKDVLRKVYREVLHVADSMKIASIAIPTIGLGMLGYPVYECATIAMEEVKGFLESTEYTSIGKIVFVVYTYDHERVFKEMVPIHFPPVDTNDNEALPDRATSTSQSVAISSANESFDQRKRTDFSSTGDAVQRMADDKKKMISRALQKANTAVLLDNAQNFKDAIEAYTDACALLQQVMMRSTSEEDRRKMDSIRVTYSRRAGELLQQMSGSRFDKQPAPKSKRAPNNQERHALKRFERHARGCSNCINVERLHSEQGRLCFVGYTAAQGVLKYLYMDANQDVYSTGAESQGVKRIEILPEYPLFWKLLAIIEKSSRDEDQDKVFVDPDQPGHVHTEGQPPPQHEGELSPGVTIYNAEAAVPRDMEYQTELDLSDLPSVPTQDPTDTSRKSPFTTEESDVPEDLRSRISALQSAFKSLQSPTFESPYSTNPQTPTLLGRRILESLKALDNPNTGLHQQQIAETLNVDVQEATRAAEHLKALGLAHTVFGDGETWIATDKSHESSGLARQPSFGQYRDKEQGETEELSASEQEMSPELGPSDDANILSSGIEGMDLAEQTASPPLQQQALAEPTMTEPKPEDVDPFVSTSRE